MNIVEECRKGNLAALLDTRTDNELLAVWVISAALTNDNNAQALCRLFQRAGTFLLHYCEKRSVIHLLVASYRDSVNTLRALCALPKAPVSALDSNSHSALHIALKQPSDCARILLMYSTALPRDVKRSNMPVELLAFRTGVNRCRRAAGRIMKRADHRWDRLLLIHMAKLIWATRACEEKWVSDEMVDALAVYHAERGSACRLLGAYAKARDEMSKRRKE